MPLPSRSLQLIGAAIPNRAFKAAMFSSGFRATGWNQRRRGFCDRTPARGYEGSSEVDTIVSGDAHVGEVRSANYEHRQGYAQQQFRPWRPSPPPFRAGPPPKSADHRNWIFASSGPTTDRERFKVLSYNILANYLALDHQSILYFHIPNHILAWEWRKRRLFIEFGLWSPDIMCLQEVDQFCDLEGELAIRGYAGVWKMRTGNAVDGCAIFWRTNRFQLRHEETIEFSKLGLRDNVAQICVLESKMRFPGYAAFPSSYNPSSGANQVVVCNTHVLYNPKRGEIKLGQVRILLDRAFAISRAWNDAPVIVCGDFNSIPLSPLYKFIASQKLNLSGLARDQISGQYSATLHSRPSSPYSSYRPQNFSRYASESRFGAQEGYCKTRSVNQHNMGNFSPFEKSAVGLYQDVEQKAPGKMPSVAATIKLGEADHGGEVSSTFSEFSNMSGRTSELCSQQNIILVNADTDKNREEAHMNILDEPCSEGRKVSSGSDESSADEIKPTSTTASPLHNTVDFSTMDSSKADDTLSEQKPCTCASLEVQLAENTENSSTGSKTGSLITCHNSGKDLYCFDGSHVSDRMSVISCIEDEKITDNVNSVGDSKKVVSDTNTENSSTGSTVKEKTGSLITCHNSGKDLFCFDGSHVSDRMSVISCIEDEKITDNVNSVGDSKKVVSDKILEENNHHSELSGSLEHEDSQSPEMFGLEENADPNFLKELIGFEDGNGSMNDAELQGDSSFPPASSALNVERRFYNPYCWSPMEMEIASGNAKCSVAEHPLKLRSVYTDVEDYTGTKDSSREPQVTSYNQQFMGTVDYIWCSEDLLTVRVLDTIPKHILQRTPGFPTQKWGSDHIALSCELAFSKGSQNK